MYKDMCERNHINYQPRSNNDVEGDSEEIKQKRMYGEGVGFERLRRITGYLVGTVDRWNNGKKAELEDREKHEL